MKLASLLGLCLALLAVALPGLWGRDDSPVPQLSPPSLGEVPYNLKENYHIMKCLDNGFDADMASIDDGIKYLQGKDPDGTVTLTLEAGQCTRVSCSYNSQIRLCNKGKLENATTSLKQIAATAQEISDHCIHDPSNPWGWWPLEGVIWDMGDTYDMETYVGYDKC